MKYFDFHVGIGARALCRYAIPTFNFSPMMPKCVRTSMDSHCGTLSTTLARSWRGTLSTTCHRCFGELTRCVFPSGERPAFCLDCWSLHGLLSYMCLAVTRLLRDIVARYSRQPRAITRRCGTTSGLFYLVRHGCLPVHPGGETHPYYWVRAFLCHHFQCR